MHTTTKYTKMVAATKLNGVEYFVHGGMRAADGGVYLTTSISEAQDYSNAGTPPKGFKLKRITRRESRPTCGGGYFIVSASTGA